MEIISLIISALTLILGIIGFWFHDCKIKKLTLKQMQEEDELKRKADLCASLKLDGNLGSAKINIKNKGKAVARNIYIVRTDNKKLYIKSKKKSRSLKKKSLLFF